MKTLNQSLVVLFFTLFFLFFFSNRVFALEYTISFTGSGAGTVIDSVVVKNLSLNSQVIVPQGSDLKLVNQLNSDLLFNSYSKNISVCQNSFSDMINVTFLSVQNSNAQIQVFGTNGTMLIGVTENLQAGKNSIELLLPCGVFILRIAGKGYSYATKLISNLQLNAKPSIRLLNSFSQTTATLQKSKNSVITMQYYSGNLLLYRAVSGKNTTIVTDKPIGNATTNFEFVECKDADANYYSVVKIGRQTWMAENLRTTRFRNSVAMYEIVIDSLWGLSKDLNWCYLDNSPENNLKYGKLYNWDVVSDFGNIAPVGWHVATCAEWDTLATYLGGTGVAGGKLKEIGIPTWKNPNYKATNESGFSALPGGSRHYGGKFYDPVSSYYFGNDAKWWCREQFSVGWGFSVALGYSTDAISILNATPKRTGCSIRCVKD